MFSTAKPLASLSSGLLARKGHARPAMRPQGYTGFASPSHAGHDDLGWNDMGEADERSAVPVAEPAALPPVLVQREALAELAAVVAPTSAAHPMALPDATVDLIGRDSARRGKAAFTLRLDAERHLRLRLASAVGNRSAQAVVTDALDALFAAMPQVEELARQLPGRETDRLGNLNR